MISPSGITLDARKVAAITDWPIPTRLKVVQSFIGFANFYRRFINGFSSLVQPLILLTRKDTPFIWTSATQNSFDALKAAFLTTPMLVHPDRTRPFQVEADASDFAIGAVLSQLNDDGTLHPVSFYSRKLTTPEINYPVYDKELATIISAFTEWRPYLAEAQHRIQVLTDHKNLIYFTTSHTLNWT